MKIKWKDVLNFHKITDVIRQFLQPARDTINAKNR